MSWSTRTPLLVADGRHPKGLIDTSVVIDLQRLSAEDLPVEIAISAVTLAELAAGPHATDDPVERARRQDRLQRAEATFDPLPVDGDVARAYGRIYAQSAVANSKGRRRRAFDLLIAATALSADLPLYTSNPKDFADISGLVEVVALRPARAAS